MAVRTVAAGLNRSFFVDANGALLACGADDKPGLLGLRGGSSQTPFTAVVPTPVPSMAGVRMRAVACRDYCNLAVSEAGQVFAWGDLEDWEEINHCAESAPEPAPILALQDHRVCQVVVAAGRCAALTEDGALFTWETARDIEMALDVPIPELGYGRFVHDVGAPYRVFAFDRVRITSVAAGTSFTVAVTEAGAVYSFGENDGRLGHGEEDARHVFLPKRIEALDCIHVVTVAAGAQHTLALTRCGSAYSWGASDLSAFELGHGNDDSEVSVSTGSCIQVTCAVHPSIHLAATQLLVIGLPVGVLARLLVIGLAVGVLAGVCRPSRQCRTYHAP
jgi:alpha-tubulin suppressor-like RCC1 family protein